MANDTFKIYQYWVATLQLNTSTQSKLKGKQKCESKLKHLHFILDFILNLLTTICPWPILTQFLLKKWTLFFSYIEGFKIGNKFTRFRQFENENSNKNLLAGTGRREKLNKKVHLYLYRTKYNLIEGTSSVNFVQ